MSCPTNRPFQPIALGDGIAVGPTPTREQIAALKAGGFRALINNRPDGEAGAPMTAAELVAAATDMGLEFRNIPIQGRNPLERDVMAFTIALAEMPRPIYACCSTGGRSASVWALASVSVHETDELVRVCAAAGFDISGLAAKMDMRREMLADDDD